MNYTNALFYYTKGKWDLSSEEFTSRNLLGKMLLLDAKMADIGMTISELKNQYILENCEFKAGEKIYYMHHTNNYKCGIIHSITYNLDSAGFSYNIKRLNKGFTESDSYRYPVNINPNGGSQAIKKA